MWIKFLEWLRDFINKFLTKKIEVEQKSKDIRENLENKLEKIEEEFHEKQKEVDELPDGNNPGGSNWWMLHKTDNSTDD